MALIDRISFDASNMDADKKDAFLKGLALHFGVKNEDQTLDISDQAALITQLKSKISDMLVRFAILGQKYTRDNVASDINIADA